MNVNTGIDGPIVSRTLICFAILISLGACTTAYVLTSSERHISIQHSYGTESVKKAFTMADQHCRQYDKIAVQTVGTYVQKGLSTSTFRCE